MQAPRKLAQAVSYLLSPLVMPVAVTSIALSAAGASQHAILTNGSVAFVAFFVIPLVGIVSLLVRGETASLDVPERPVRTRLFAVTFVAGVLGLLVCQSLGLETALVLPIMASFVLILAATAWINLFWKISVHMIAISGALAILLAVSTVLGPGGSWLRMPVIVPFLLLIPLVGWSRLYLRAHTIDQIVGGALLGFFGHFAAILLLGSVIA